MQLKKALKSLVPPSLQARIRTWKAERAIAVFEAEWRESRRNAARIQVRRPIERILLVPPDPGTLMGALGDDAMVTSVVEMARARNPEVEIEVLTGRPVASEMAVAHGLKPVEIWESPHFVRDLDALLTKRRYDAVVALGADIMDAYHDFLGSAKMIAVVDLPARRGIPSSVLGFSFNARPNPRLAAHFAGVSPDVRFRLRDEISFERFGRFSPATSELVADSAFVLTPGAVADDLGAWIDAMHADGRKVIGINVHPMLFRDATDEQIATIVQRGADALLACAETARVAWLLLPHDYRGRLGDAVCLEPIRDRVAGILGDTVRHLDGRHRASTLKAVAGRLDGVVSGRMHLAIATLGMGVPALCATYQDKFEGLYRHFGLPDWLLLSPESFLVEGTFRDALARFIQQLPELTRIVGARREAVLALSRQNFTIFDDVAQTARIGSAGQGGSPAPVQDA
ncbi:hypothetical protein EYW49_21145 [Siculibacillus lacustris]|uniref:Polysaccharide pyruvyl transferase domain-containing protein n=1 Tax=Siculibacillus lacustris TaxID=1549641 RepID=A0A4Q9VE22_9HYPH|nr:polysaccharide pyruvyl transferase family protein [Siculibacillus lacustris]TBW32961.1 hypothetical protein EYW49_21145 [Siculibacillus lacustris]